jgi:hypothetical protein
MAFRRATRAQAKLRLALVGPSGSGKTYSALALAKGLGGRCALVDTERGSSEKYAGDFDFDVLSLESFAPGTYVEAIRAAADAGYDVLIIDSLSHAWSGKDGALEMVDAAARRSKSGSSFHAWRDVTPEHNRLVDAIVSARMHVIVTMRTKTEYVSEKDDRGKTVVRKVGLQPVQRDGLEYEFDVVADIDLDHVASISKTRCSALADKSYRKPGDELAGVLRAWLSDGTATPPPQPRPVVDVATTLPAPPDAVDVSPPSLEELLDGCADTTQFRALCQRIAREVPAGTRRDSLRERARIVKTGLDGAAVAVEEVA